MRENYRLIQDDYRDYVDILAETEQDCLAVKELRFVLNSSDFTLKDLENALLGMKTTIAKIWQYLSDEQREKLTNKDRKSVV